MTDWDLLQSYRNTRSDDAFAELVKRHLDLVYSVALRQVRQPQLAEEVAQSVFIDLARGVDRLASDTVLAAWLYRVARRTAVDVIRRESRRQLRESMAPELTSMNATSNPWSQIEPLLDEALDTLEDTERNAVLLRFFQGKSLREVGSALGTSEEAAQKRVSRAVDRLREFFSKQGIAVGSGALVLALTANATTAAPTGLGASITAATALAVSAAGHATTIGITKTIAMTTLQKTVIGAALIAAVGAGVYEAQRAAKLEKQLDIAAAQTPATATDEVSRLRAEHAELTNQLAGASEQIAQLRRDTAELAKLRGESARLRREMQSAASTTALGHSNDTTGAAAQSWLARSQQLRQRFDAAPDQKIPEFAFLTDEDWLSAARGKLESENDYRSAMSALRHSAESHFGSILRPALTKFVEQTGHFPTDLSQLQTYFKTPVDAAVLDRYAILPAGAVPNVRMGGEWIVTQKGPVDEEYDSRIVLGPNGYGSTDFKSSTVASRADIDLLAPVVKAYAAANNGHEPSDAAQLQPYLSTPEQQAAFQRVAEKLKKLGNE